MSDLGEERFALTATPPVRALALAAAMAIVGAALAVGSRALGPVALAVGIAGLVVAVVLALGTAVLAARIRSTLLLDPQGITVIRGRRTDHLLWSDINRVNLAGPRLTFVTEPDSGAGVSVINPGSRTDPTFLALIAAIRGRLNADRGYRTR